MSERDEPTKGKRPDLYTEAFSLVETALEDSSPASIGTIVKRITKQSLQRQHKSRTDKWKDLKDKALAKALDLKSRGSEYIFVGMGFAENKLGEQEERMYFVFLGNEANPLYITGVPLPVIAKINKYRQTHEDLRLDDVSQFISKVHKRK